MKNTAELRASIPWESANYCDCFIAEVEVASDAVAGRRGNKIDRIISGNVLRKHPDLDRFVAMWTLPCFQNLNTPYGDFWRVPNLQVNRDHYGFISGIRLVGNAVTIMVSEDFSGADSEYYSELERRNSRIDQRIAKWVSRQVTMADLMELIGDDSHQLDNPHAPLSLDIINSVIRQITSYGSLNGFLWRTNQIV